MTSTNITQQPATVQAWLTQRGVTGCAKHHIARALGVSLSEVDALLLEALTAESLLNLNRLVQHKHLALANRVWPNCTWLDFDSRHGPQHPVIDLILSVFGHDLLDYVIRTFGRDVVLEYWRELKVPDEYDDIHLEDEDLSPILNVPDEQMVDNPHSDFEADEGEFFIFGHPATAECFRWLIERRSHYSLYVGNRTGYVNDPMGIQMAYDMRDALKREYWATLPPDTLPAYLAIAHSLQWAMVPEAWEEGRLPPLHIIELATLTTDRLEVLQTDLQQIWLDDRDALTFDRQPLHVFALQADADDAAAAVILTTQTEPGNPEQHLANPPLRYLHCSDATSILAFVPRDMAEDVRLNICAYEDVIYSTLSEVDHGIDAETGIFCICRFNP